MKELKTKLVALKEVTPPPKTKPTLEKLADKLIVALVYTGLFGLAADDMIRHLTNLNHIFARAVTASVMIVVLYIILKNK